MKTRWISALLLLLLSLSAFAQDYICTTSKQRFYQPGACKKNCTPTREGNALTRGATMADRPCSFQPSCVGITKHLTAPASGDLYVLSYGAVAFGKRAGFIMQPEMIIINLALLRYYHTSIHQFNVHVGPVNGGDGWAALMPAMHAGGLPSLTVSPDLYAVSPGFLISVLGHEMVHDQQYKRKNTIDQTGFVSLVDALRELEGSYFQQGIDTLDRGFTMEVSLCMADDERLEIRQVTACREWQVKKAIENIRLKPDVVARAEKWMLADPWAKQVYIPQHPDWKTARAGNPPDETCSPTAKPSQ